ncbi:olfactory receptor 52N2-like [Spea bombifrons]|uniref:olfactory receptor 52N2-like n=1 Tax=Spea bombifrons TaxID=233779 RepID=UPI0023491F3D|nr:olfactory receptor 52N2-like [Spea bombifrons]
MGPSNNSFPRPNVFFLIGVPGLEVAHARLSVPLFFMYLTAILGNMSMMLLIIVERRLHSPMYYFLSTLSITDVVLSTSIALKMLGIFWFDLREIDFVSCLIQMFFVHCFTSLESGVLLAMAFDRYVAICTPLHYTTMLTNTLIIKIVLALLIRGTAIVTPCPLMASWLPYCHTHHIPHSYCDHMSVVKLACTNTTVNNAYGLTVVLLVIAFDVAFITVSYSLILKAVLQLSCRTSRNKAFSTCTSHVCVILVFYSLGLFSFLTHRIGHIAPYIHVILSNLYLLIPPMLNPIVYGVKTKEIRRSAARLLSCTTK